MFRSLTAEALAGLLRQWASRVRLEAFRRHRRGPKKPGCKRKHTKKKPHEWEKTQEEVEQLRALTPHETSAVDITPIP